MRNRRTLILFDRGTIRDVLPAFADEVRTHWPTLTPGLDIRAVASRHRPAGESRGNWPKTLVEYFPEYRTDRGYRMRVDSLCSWLRQAATLNQVGSSPAEIVDLITFGIATLLRYEDDRDSNGQPVNKRNLWSLLAARDAALPLKLRCLVREKVLLGGAAWEAPAWNQFSIELMELLGNGTTTSPRARQFLNFTGPNEAAAEARHARTVFTCGELSIRLGSIHSVKGKTVDGILIVETEVWRRNQGVMDLETVLPHAFGLENRSFAHHAAQLAAATNIFVAATRPRQLLSFAMRKEAASEALIAAARHQGWNVRDLTP